MSTTKLGKEQKFAKALQSGRVITRRQATSQYKLGNPSATVNRLETRHGLRINREYKYDPAGFITSVKYSIKTKTRTTR